MPSRCSIYQILIQNKRRNNFLSNFLDHFIKDPTDFIRQFVATIETCAFHFKLETNKRAVEIVKVIASAEEEIMGNGAIRIHQIDYLINDVAITSEYFEYFFN